MTAESSQDAAFLDSVELRWRALLPTLSPYGIASKVLDGRAIGKLVIEVQCATYLALIEAWTQATCLDVTVLDLGSGKSTILSSGPCVDASDVDTRLRALCASLTSRGGTS